MKIRLVAKACVLTALLTAFESPIRAEEPTNAWEKVVFHLDEASNARWALMLARSYMDDSPEAKIVFVAYGPGVDFLLKDAEDKRGNPYDRRVATLVERGVEFRICAATLSARDISEENLLDAAYPCKPPPQRPDRSAHRTPCNWIYPAA